MNIAALFAKEYWFSYPPTLSRDTAIVYLTVLGALFLLGIIIKIVGSRRSMRAYVRRVSLRAGTLLLSGAVVGALLLFFRYEYIPFLSWRILFGVWALWLIAWALLIGRFWIIAMRESKQKIALYGDQERIQAYLPRRKK